MKFFYLILLFLVCAAPVKGQNQTQLLSPEQRMAEIKAMHWINEGTLKLALSNSTLALPAGFQAVTGSEANRLVELVNAGTETRADSYLFDASNNSEVLLQYINSGYVTLDDLSELKPDTMLQQIKDATEEANSRRTAAGMEEMHVRGWLQQPTFDHATNTAYWAIAAVTPSNGLVNAVALRLGRDGYEKFTWVVSPEKFNYVGGTLDVVLRAQAFDPGHRYSDHVSGDKAAGYGVAALIGAVAGAKVLKVVAAGGLLLLLKKLWILPLLFLGGFWAWVRNLFRRKKDT